jgi:hypothetical protein
MSVFLKVILFFALGAVLILPTLLAQGTDLGTIRGTVTDPSGAVIPNAKVQVTDVATNVTRDLVTNAEGDYEASALRTGNYLVRVSAPGFASYEITTVTLTAGAIVRADARLTPASETQSIVITSEAPLIHTENQTISQTLSSFVVNELPRDSRDIYSFLYLNPNITQADSDGGFKFIGSQSYGGSFSLDGQRSNGGVFGQPTQSQPSLEAVGEISVLSNDFTAEYAGIANVRVDTARGGKQYHGSLFYNNKNAALAAWNLRDKIAQSQFLPTPALSNYPYPFFNLNEFGGSFSGHVPKIKDTYFLFAYERRYSDAPVNMESTRLPGPLLLQGDFSQLKDSAKPAVPANVSLTAGEIATNTVGGLGKQFIKIPQRLLNPVTTKLISTYFPQINASAPINTTTGRIVDYFTSAPGLLTRDLGTVRLDHTFSVKDTVSAVYNVQSRNSATSPVVSPYVGLGLTQNALTDHTLSLSHTHLFTASLVNELRGGFNKEDTFRHSNQTLRQFLSGIGFDQSDITAYAAVTGAAALDTYGHPAVAIGNFLSFSNGGRNTYRPLNQNLQTYGDTLSWMRRSHTIKAGADVVRNAATDGFVANRGNPRGLVTYTGNGPDALARFLMGLPGNSASVVTGLRPPMQVHNWEQGYFVQDDWKIHPRLTLNLGLRYEIITPFIEANDLLVNFDPNYTSPSGVKGRFIIPSAKALPYVDPRMIAYGYTTADKAGVGRGLVNTDWTKFAPRLGAAWRVSQRSVLRGGYGWYFPTSAAQGIRDAMASSPFNQGRTITNTAAAPLNPWPGFTHGISPLSGGQLRALANLPSFNNIPFGLKEPRVEQYNVTFEQEIGWKTALRFSYLGTRMHDLITGRDLNMLPPNSVPFGTTMGDGVTPCDPYNGDCTLSPADNARLPFPGLGDYMASYGNFGHGRSNALQIQANRRFADGLLFQATYTYLNQKSTAVDSGNSSLGGTAYNQFQPNSDYGIDSYVPAHRAVFYTIYQLPVGKGRKYGSGMNWLTDLFVGGWETSWQGFLKSGTGFTPFWVCDNCGPVYPGNIGSSFIDAVGDFNTTSFRPIVTANPDVKHGDQIFDPNAFAPPSVGADLLSNSQVAKRNLLMGPSTFGLNLGVHKKFHFGERVIADLGADFNNILNHPLLSPDQGGADSGFMQLGDFNIAVDQKTGKLLPITDVTPNPNFGRLITSYTQEGVDSRRTVRLKLRITF